MSRDRKAYMREYHRKRMEQDPDFNRKRSKKVRERRRALGLCPQCGTEPAGIKPKTCKRCTRKEQMGRVSRARNRKIKQFFLDYYGSECACCGESTWEFLCIDHVNNDGAEQRGRNGNWRYNLWKEINETGLWPTDLQTLCFNCNSAKWLYGVCPHQTTKKQVA